MNVGRVYSRNLIGAPRLEVQTMKPQSLPPGPVRRAGHSDESLRKFAWATEQSPDAIMITDAAGVIEYVNAAFEAMTGYARVEVLGRTPAVLRSGAQDAAFYRGLWATINGGRTFRGILVNRKRSGETYHEEKTIQPFVDRKGRITHFICAGRDVSKRVREVEKLTHAATHDGLTDLPSRNLFFDRLGQALRNAKRREEGFALAVVDLDRFKEINDRFGHLAGDALLRAVALRLQQSVRESDTVARLSGDEFALILAGAGERAVVSRLLDKVLSLTSVPVRFEHHALHVGLSIGVCIYPRDGRSGEELHKRADAAMYAAKRAGGNRYHYFRSRKLSTAEEGGATHFGPAGHARRAVAAKLRPGERESVEAPLDDFSDDDAAQDAWLLERAAEDMQRDDH